MFIHYWTANDDPLGNAITLCRVVYLVPCGLWLLERFNHLYLHWVNRVSYTAGLILSE